VSVGRGNWGRRWKRDQDRRGGEGGEGDSGRGGRRISHVPMYIPGI